MASAVARALKMSHDGKVMASNRGRRIFLYLNVCVDDTFAPTPPATDNFTVVNSFVLFD